MRHFLLCTISLIFFASQSWAATGDTIWSCTFQSSTLCSPYYSSSSHAFIETGGWDGQRYLDFNPTVEEMTGIGDHYDPFVVNVNHQEITLVYYERYDVAAGEYLWNVKSVRPYFTDEAGYFAFQSREYDEVQNTMSPGRTVAYTVASDYEAASGANCTHTSTYVYTCTDGQIIVDHPYDFDDTSWHKVRYHVKAPSSSSATDGEIHLWIDEHLVYSATNIIGASGIGNVFDVVKFNPSADIIGDTQVSFHHSYDDIVIYEGYVPPVAASSSGSLRPGVSAAGVTFR